MHQKVLVLGGLNWLSLTNGFLYGQVAGMVGSLQKNEEGIDLSEGQISLIASAVISMTLFGAPLSAVITDRMGRRWPFVLFSIAIVINWLILYQATEYYQFMLSRIIGGIACTALWTLNIFVTSEYTSPKTRAFFLNMVTTATPAIGTGLGHAIGVVLHWRTVAFIAIFPSALGIILPYFWVESPHWLASKERFEECETAFRRLHGSSTNSERELQLLIKMEKTKLDVASKSNSRPTLKRLLAVFKRKFCWELLLMSMFMNAYMAASGKVVFSVLATVILEEVTGTSDVLLFTIIVDGFILFGSCMSCVLIRKTSMRTLLFSTGFTANVILVIFSICYYFKNVQTYFNWINITLLALYFIIINAGPYPLLEAIYSEMFPLELKVYIFSLSVIVLVTATTLSVVLLPSIVSAIGYHGLFLLNASITTASLGYLWLTLPETKGKTLQEIEIYFKTNNFDIDEVLRTEQLNTLL